LIIIFTDVSLSSQIERTDRCLFGCDYSMENDSYMLDLMGSVSTESHHTDSNQHTSNLANASDNKAVLKSSEKAKVAKTKVKVKVKTIFKKKISRDRQIEQTRRQNETNILSRVIQYEQELGGPISKQ
jgi:hypothetical protein